MLAENGFMRPTGGVAQHAAKTYSVTRGHQRFALPTKGSRHGDLPDRRKLHSAESPHFTAAPHTLRLWNGHGEEVDCKWNDHIPPTRPEATRSMERERPRPSSARTSSQHFTPKRLDTPSSCSLLDAMAIDERAHASHAPKIYTVDPVSFKHEHIDTVSPGSASTTWRSSEGDDGVYQVCPHQDERRCAMQVVRCPRGGACWVPDSPQRTPRRPTSRTFDSSLMRARFSYPLHPSAVAQGGSRLRAHSARR